MTPTVLNRICARPVGVSWVIGACVLETLVLRVPTDGVRLTSIASDWQGLAFLLLALTAAAGLGFFLGMFTCWPWIRPICSRLNGAPLKTGDRVLVLAGPHKGITALVYAITTGQGGWSLARLDLGIAHRDKFTDIVEEYSVFKINGVQDGAAKRESADSLRDRSNVIGVGSRH
jgi:hypothetical protein